MKETALQTKFEEIQQRLIELSPENADCFRGATDTAIAELEHYAGGPLPLAYRIFLERMGESAGGLFRGSHALLSQKWSLKYRTFAERMLEKNKAEFAIPGNAFVFLMHQGYQFLYICLDEGEDPPVYAITDVERKPEQISNHFTSFVENFVSDLEAIAATKSPT